MSVLQKFAQALGADHPNRGASADCVRRFVPDVFGALIAASAASEGRDLRRRAALAATEDSLLDRVARAVALVRLTEADDIHLHSCTTAGAIVIPVALLLSAELDAPPGEAIGAIVAGYEALIRFAEAVNGPNILYRGLWPTYLAAPLGGAAAAARLLGLNAIATAHALAIALAQTSGAPGRTEGKTSRWILAGLAARAGCVSALLARDGFEGDLSLLDGDWLARTHGLEIDPAALLGSVSAAVLEVSQKPYCGARQTIAASQAFRRLLAESSGPDGIEGVRVFVPSIYAQMISQPASSRTGRIASVAYQLALAAYRADDLWDIERPPLRDARIDAFCDLVTVVGDAALDPLYPQSWPARVEVTSAGRLTVATVETAEGDPGDPLSDRTLERKFLALTRAAVADPPSAFALAKRGLTDHVSFRALCAEASRWSRSINEGGGG